MTDGGGGYLHVTYAWKQNPFNARMYDIRGGGGKKWGKLGGKRVDYTAAVKGEKILGQQLYHTSMMVEAG